MFFLDFWFLKTKVGKNKKKSAAIFCLYFIANDAKSMFKRVDRDITTFSCDLNGILWFSALTFGRIHLRIVPCAEVDDCGWQTSGESIVTVREPVNWMDQVLTIGQLDRLTVNGGQENGKNETPARRSLTSLYLPSSDVTRYEFRWTD